MKKSLRKKLELLAIRFAIYADEALDESVDREGGDERAWLNTAANLAAASAQVSMALEMRPKCYDQPMDADDPLDRLAERAIADYEAGRTRDISAVARECGLVAEEGGSS